ncbi:MAG: tripartite tricarboxylate transporter substrate binding protein, partial [Alphaproteobacteria bacterium]
MRHRRRELLRIAASAAALAALPRTAWAENYPVRPVRLIVGYPAGGSTD